MSDPFEAGRQSKQGQRYASMESREATIDAQDDAFAALVADLKDRLSEHGVPAYTNEELYEIRWGEDLLRPDQMEAARFGDDVFPSEEISSLYIGNHLLIFFIPGEPGYRLRTSEKYHWLGDHFDMLEVFPPEELEGIHPRDRALEICGRMVEPYARWKSEYVRDHGSIPEQIRKQRALEVADDIAYHTKGFVRWVVEIAVTIAIGYAIYYFVYIQDIIGIAEYLEPIFGFIERVLSEIWRNITKTFD